MNHEVVQLLSGEEFGNCVDNYGNDGSFDSCIYSNVQRLMMEEVGCTVPWIPDKSQICTDETKRKKAFDVYQQNRRNQKVTSKWGQTFSKVAFEYQLIHARVIF